MKTAVDNDDDDAISVITVIEKEAQGLISNPLEAVCRDLNMIFSNILIEAVRQEKLPVPNTGGLKDLMSNEDTRLRNLLILELPLQHHLEDTSLKGFLVEIDWESPNTFVIYVDAPESFDPQKDDRVLH